MKYIYPALHTLVWLEAASAAAVPKYPGFRLKRFTSAVIFGDSYTDQGVHQYRPAADGSVGTPSNVTSTGGRVWPEYVNQYSGAIMYDYAVSGAVCNQFVSPDNRNGVEQDQVPTFLIDNDTIDNSTGKRVLDNPSDETIYAIWIGTNDLGNGAYLADEEPFGMPISNYTDCVYSQFDIMHGIGARNFILMNVAPLNLVPQYALPDAGGVNSSEFWLDKLAYDPNITQISEKMRHFSQLVNSVYEYETPFEVKVANRYPGSTFAIFDVHSLLTDMYNNPSEYLNGSAPLNVTGSIHQCALTNCSSLNSPDSFLWFDELHPSEQTDRIIAREFVKVVNGTSQWSTFWSS